MLLKSRHDGFKLSLPKEFLTDTVSEKYAKILRQQHEFIYSPIEFLNETIQSIEVLGFNNGSIMQQQTAISSVSNRTGNIETRMHTASDVPYRSPASPYALVDKTLNITFRHSLGYLNYFMLFESFLDLYSRQTPSNKLPHELTIDLCDGLGSVYARLVFSNPIIDSMDMLSFDYTKPTAESMTFKLVIKYSAFKYNFLRLDDITL